VVLVVAVAVNLMSLQGRSPFDIPHNTELTTITRNLPPLLQPNQTFTQPFKQPLALTNPRDHRTMFTQPIPIYKPFFILRLVRQRSTQHAIQSSRRRIPNQPRKLDPFFVAIPLRLVEAQVKRYFLDAEGDAAAQGGLRGRASEVCFCFFSEGRDVGICRLDGVGDDFNVVVIIGFVTIVGVCGTKPFPHSAFLFVRLDALLQPVILVDEGLPDVAFGEQSEIGDNVAPFLEFRDDGVAKIGDEDCHGGNGDETPDDEEAAAGVGFGREIAVADC
jgi:hypothetical protein